MIDRQSAENVWNNIQSASKIYVQRQKYKLPKKHLVIQWSNVQNRTLFVNSCKFSHLGIVWFVIVVGETGFGAMVAHITPKVRVRW